MGSEYTVKEIADILGVSKSTIQRAIVSASIGPAREGRQKRYYDQEGTTRIIKVVSPDFDISGLFPAIQTEPETEATDSETEPTAPGKQKQTDTTEANTEATDSKAFQTAIEALQKELEVKNRQIEAQANQLAAKDKQIETLLQTVREQSEAIKSAHALAAGDKQLLLSMQQEKKEPEAMDAEAEDPDQEAEPEELDAWGYDIYGKYHGKEPIQEPDHNVVYHPKEWITPPKKTEKKWWQFWK